MADSGSGSEGSDSRIGRRVARYRILEKIGQGGMGEVFLAEDDSLGRRVALKFMPMDSTADSIERKRFLRGAKSAAALDHPYICSIYEMDEFEGQPFIAMEYVRGETLEKHLREGGMDLRRAVGAATEIAEALETAHAEGIIHRDLKPSNVMLTLGGHVKVLDFGLAKRVETPGGAGSQYETASKLTGEGSTLGTLAYMSPEQVRGQPVDGRSDIFSFGVVLYEMLAGVHPFSRKTAIDTVAAILNQPPDPVEEHRSDAPAELSSILQKMLEKPVEERYQNVEDVRLDLEQVPVPRSAKRPASSPSKAETTPPSESKTSGYPVVRVATDSARRAIEKVTRRSLAIGAAAIATLAIVAYLVTSLGGPEGSYGSVAVLPLRNLSEDPADSNYLAEGIGQAVQGRLLRAGIRVTPWETARRFAASRDAPAEIARELNVDALLSGTLSLDDDSVSATLSLVDAASGETSWEDRFEQSFDDLFRLERDMAYEAASRISADLDADARQALTEDVTSSLDAYDFYLQGEHITQEGTQEAVNVAVRYFNRAIEFDPTMTEARVGLGAALTERYFNGWDGLASLDQAETQFEMALDSDPGSMEAIRGLIRVKNERGDSEACLALGRQAEERGAEGTVETLLARADAFAICGQLTPAPPLYREALEIDSANEAAHWGLIMSHAWLGESPQAVSAGRDYQRRFGDDHEIHHLVAIAHHLARDSDSAREHYEKAVELATVSAVEREPFSSAAVFDALLFGGFLYEQMGEERRAERSWRRGLEIVRPKLASFPDNPKLRLYLVTFYGLLGDDAAFARERELALSSDFNALELRYLALVHARRGEFAEAAAVLERTLAGGRVHSGFEMTFRLAGISPDAPELTAFYAEYEDAASRLLESNQ